MDSVQDAVREGGTERKGYSRRQQQSLPLYNLTPNQFPPHQPVYANTKFNVTLSSAYLDSKYCCCVWSLLQICIHHVNCCTIYVPQCIFLYTLFRVANTCNTTLAGKLRTPLTLQSRALLEWLILVQMVDIFPGISNSSHCRFRISVSLDPFLNKMNRAHILLHDPY